ncbi:MAG: Uma2 family endonuclease [Isosphaeraceae bacterium]
MSTVVETPATPAASSVKPYDLTVDLLSRMVEAGMLPEDRRIYLREGRLYEKMAKTKAHGYVGASINMALVPRLPAGWGLWPESTIVLDHTNAPLPDLAVIRGMSPLDYGSPDRYPEARDVGLLIEIAVTGLREDLTASLELYARSLIPAYWVVDVVGKRILAHSDPHVVDGRGTYARVETFLPGHELPLILDGQEVARIPFDDMLR